MEYCEDCGCKVYGGICSNCQEELYIFENQNEFMKEISDEFSEKIISQRKQINQKVWVGE